MAEVKPLRKTILVTGASGFIGRHFINAVKDDFFIYAIARRNQHEANIPLLPNIQWIPLDLGDRESVNRMGDQLAQDGGVDYVFHYEKGRMGREKRCPAEFWLQYFHGIDLSGSLGFWASMV